MHGCPASVCSPDTDVLCVSWGMATGRQLLKHDSREVEWQTVLRSALMVSFETMRKADVVCVNYGRVAPPSPPRPVCIEPQPTSRQPIVTAIRPLTPVQQTLWVVVWLCIGPLIRCVCVTDGALWMWGGNGDGQLGDGTRDNKPRPGPVTVTGCSNVSHIALGGSHSAALCAGMPVP